LDNEAPRDVPLLVFDGDCAFCRIWIGFWKSLTGDSIAYAPYQEVAGRFPQIPLDNFKQAVQLILPDGEVFSAAKAVFRSLAHISGYTFLLPAYESVPGFGAVAEWCYRRVAAHRNLFYKVTVFLWGRHIERATYEIAVRWFLRCLGVVYLIAFVSFEAQITGLIGTHGILPAANFLAAVRENYGSSAVLRLPTIFWLGSSDLFLKLTSIAGAISGLAIILGFARRAAMGVAFVLYLSLVCIGQTFFSFQWDYLLLESGFLGIFLLPLLSRVWLFRWLLFRLMFLSGTAKLLSHDPAWRNLTVLEYHYQTQPLPTPFAWYFHQLPPDFQKLSCLFVFLVELAVPFLIFAPRRLRFFAGAMTIALQALIFITGNYAFFNLLAVAACLLLYDDAALRRRRKTPVPGPEPRVLSGRPAQRRRRAVTLVLFFFILLASGFELLEVFTGTIPEPGAMALSWIAPFGVVNTYGLFAVMTTSRLEIIVEGSNDGQTWLAYGFKYKPGDPKRAPAWVQPYQPRLDWQMWFAALGSYQSQRWFISFMERLLEGSPDVLALLDKNPFLTAPPRYVRAQVYDYKFTTIAERRATGDWWRHEPKGTYFPVVSLRQR
jgi:predicted DCC family thiol-disulfide oxidoreductase YuxK